MSDVSDLILDFIHSEIFIIALIILLLNLYFLQVFLDTSETIITIMVASHNRDYDVEGICCQ